jgi:uncharacterized protein (DUF885 family)
VKAVVTGSGKVPVTSERFRAFVHDDWLRWLSEYPELATEVGHEGLNDRWTDDSPDGIERRRVHLRESLAQLREFDRESLASADRPNFDLYEDLLRSAEEGVAFGLDPLPFGRGQPHDLQLPMNQIEGVHISAPDLLEIAPRRRAADYEDRLARLRALPKAIREQRSLLEAGLAKGLTPPRVAVAGLPGQVESLARAKPSESAFLTSFREFPSAVGEREGVRLAGEAWRVVRDVVHPALEELHDFLVSRYVPACRVSLGASDLPDGTAKYAHLARRSTTTDLSPQAIHEIGLREVQRVRSEMEAVMRRSGFPGSFAEFKEFLRTDPRFSWPTAEELLDRYRALAKRIDPELGRLFGRLPRLPYGVDAVPRYREATSPAAYYIGGVPATGQPGTFYANTYQVATRPKWEMEALTLHEAVPGHHLQIALAQELDRLPEFRRFSGPTAFTEGWGLYAESLGEEVGLYRDPYSKVGQLMFDAWRSIRLVVDTGIHALGWSREKAIEFFREHTGMSDVGISVEVDRYIVWPGQALAYKIGQLKIRELRTWAESSLGERFDVRAFHDAVLGEGAVPLGLLEAQVRAWVDRQRVATPVGSGGPGSSGHRE